MKAYEVITTEQLVGALQLETRVGLRQPSSNVPTVTEAINTTHKQTYYA